MPKTLATATVDLLLHDARVIITDGQDSYRLVLPLRPVSSIEASFQSGLPILVLGSARRASRTRLVSVTS